MRLVERRLVKKRFLPPEEKTEAQRKNDRLLRTTALTLCAALALSAFAARALVGFGDTRLLAEGVEFTDFDSFKRYMRKPVEPTYYGDAAPAPDTAVAESPLYYENDTPIYRSQTEGATIEDDNGNVLCCFIWRNRSVVFVADRAKGRRLPARHRLHAGGALACGSQKAEHDQHRVLRRLRRRGRRRGGILSPQARKVKRAKRKRSQTAALSLCCFQM